MVEINKIRAAFIARLKATAAVTALLSSSNEVRESEWQGTTFTYPNVRVGIDSITPIASCDSVQFTASIYAFDEDGSSLRADAIASEVFKALHEKPFSYLTERYTIWAAGIIPAIRQDERTWRSEVTIMGIAENSH